MRMKKLEVFARERGYLLERKNREIKWTRNDSNIYGVSYSVNDAYDDIILDYQGRMSDLQRCSRKGILGRKCG